LAWRIEISDTAKKQLAKLDRQVQAEILRYLRERIATGEAPRRYGEPLSEFSRTLEVVNNTAGGHEKISGLRSAITR